jgi:hypothetical protein
LQFARNARDKVKEQADIVEAQIKKVIDTSENNEQSEAEFNLADKANDVAQDVVDNKIWNKQNLSQQLENREEDGHMYAGDGSSIFIMPVVNAAEAKIAMSCESCEIRLVAEVLAEAVAWAHIAKLRFEVVKAARGNYQKQDAAFVAAKAEREKVIEPLIEVRKKKAKAEADAERVAQAGEGGEGGLINEANYRIVALAGEGGLINEANYRIVAFAYEAKIKRWEAEIKAANARFAKLIEEYELSSEDLERKGKDSEGKDSEGKDSEGEDSEGKDSEGED